MLVYLPPCLMRNVQPSQMRRNAESTCRTPVIPAAEILSTISTQITTSEKLAGIQILRNIGKSSNAYRSGQQHCRIWYRYPDVLSFTVLTPPFEYDVVHVQGYRYPLLSFFIGLSQGLNTASMKNNSAVRTVIKTYLSAGSVSALKALVCT